MAVPVLAGSGDLPPTTLDKIVETYAGNFYRKGEASGLSVAVTLNGHVFYKSFGSRSYGDSSPGNAVNEHSIFEIGSVTKIWTTALVGQAVATGSLTNRPIGLYTTLGSLSGPLPNLQSAMKPATIGELASFTAGFPGEYNPIQNERPSYLEWGVADFVAAISTFVPKDYTKKPIVPTALPAPYKYSDFSTGLLGLLVTNNLDAALPADAVQRWGTAILDHIVDPLGMTNTYVFEPDLAQALRVVRGYEQATAKAVVNSRRIAQINVVDGGGYYSAAPTVTIEQPGGSGATARAVMSGTAPRMTVKNIVVTNPGSGYRAAPSVNVIGAGKKAEAEAIIIDGKLAGVQVLNGGSNYGPNTTLQFSAGAGSGAAAEAILSGGELIGAVVTNPGSGYFAPPVVRIAPGANIANVVPVWAAAGAIKSSVSDLIRLCQLYLGYPEIDGHPVPTELSLGARYAILPLVQEAAGNATNFAGMAWDVSTQEIPPGYNLKIFKDGGLSGFGSFITLVPAAKLGVVVLCNNHNSGNYDKTSLVADSISLAIQQALKEQE